MVSIFEITRLVRYVLHQIQLQSSVLINYRFKLKAVPLVIAYCAKFASLKILLQCTETLLLSNQ